MQAARKTHAIWRGMDFAMTTLTCDFITLDGTPCQNPVAPGTDHCAAGHPVDSVPAPSLEESRAHHPSNPGTADFEDVIAPAKNNLQPTYAVNVAGLYDAVKAWDEDHDKEFVAGPRSWGEFVDDEYYAAAFINHLAEYDAWSPLWGAPKMYVWAEHDDAYGADRGVTLHLSRPNDDLGTSVTSPRIYVRPHNDGWYESLTFEALGITADTDLAAALSKLGEYQGKMIRSVAAS